MVRAIRILAVDVSVFMLLIMMGAVIQGALPWPSFVVPFFFLPAFLYVAYRDPDRSRVGMRGVLWMTISVSVAMGVVFDIVRFPVGSLVATLLIIGMISIAYPFLSTQSR